jgi:hypothetical protein
LTSFTAGFTISLYPVTVDSGAGWGSSDLCYTLNMDVNVNQAVWRDWAAILQRWGMRDLAASFLEALGPLVIFGAQAVYVSQPLLNGIIPTNRLQALADLLEDSSQVKAFAAFLREEDST